LKPLSNIWPWFDRRALPVYEATRGDERFAGRPSVTGLPDSYKYGIYKFLTLLGSGSYEVSSVCWIGLVAYTASLLTGECAEDISIAARTGCLALRTGSWDEAFIRSLGLTVENFPRLIRQGGTAGILRHSLCGLPKGIPVCIGGHDHVCAAYAAGALQSRGTFISTGTAQVVLGTTDDPSTSSGLSYGPSPVGQPYTVLGSIQSAGGSINFWRKQLFPDQGYTQLLEEVATAPVPSGLLYYPYLAGSGAPHLDPTASGVLIGLRDHTNRGQIIAAVYEGIAMETRFLIDTMRPDPSSALYCLGGLTRHPRYMQTLADVLGRTVRVPDLDEGTLYGAAILCSDHLGRAPLPTLTPSAVYQPDSRSITAWNDLYMKRYLPLMDLTKTEV